MKKIIRLITFSAVAFWPTFSPAPLVYHPGTGWVYEGNATNASTTNYPARSQTAQASSASANPADQINELRAQLAEQTKRIDRLYETLGPELAQMEERAAVLKKQQAEDAAYAMHEIFRSKDRAFNSKLLFVPGSQRLAVAQNGGEVSLLELPAGNVVATLGGTEGDIECLGTSSDGKKIFAGMDSGAVFVWTESQTNAQKIFDWSGWPVTALAASPDGARVVIACNGKRGTNNAWTTPDDSLVALEAATGKKLWSDKVGRGDFQAVSFAGDGKTLSAVHQGEVVIFEADTGRVLHRLLQKKYPTGPLSTAMSRDGKLCAVGYGPKDIGIWDASEGKCLRLLGAHGNWVVSLAFSPDGAWLASSSGDTTASVWNVATGQEVGRLRFGDGYAYVNSVSISSDGRWLAAGRGGEFVVLEMPQKTR